jgi:integrase
MRGVGSIRKRKGGGYQIRYRINGERKEESVAEALGKPAARVTRQDARDLLMRRVGAVVAGQTKRPEALTVAAVLDGYVARAEQMELKRVDTIVAHLRPVRVALGHRRVDELRDVEILNAYVTQRLDSFALTGGPRPRAKATTVSRGTVGRELAHLRAALQVALRQRRLTEPLPYVPSLKRPTPRKARVDVDAFDRIAAHLGGFRYGDPDIYRELGEFTFASGWRYDEVMSVRWEYVDWDEGVIRLPDTKNNDPRVLPLEGAIQRVIQARRGKRRLDSPWVFHKDGRRITAGFRGRWKVARAKAGLPGVRIHDCRRAVVHGLRLLGVHKLVSKAIVGHRSDAIHEDYDDVSVDEKRAALRALEAYREERRRGTNVVDFAARLGSVRGQ